MPNPVMPNPVMPTELAEIIARNSRFDGYRMMADEQTPETPSESEQKPADDAGADGFKSPESKQRVLSDLHDIRNENKTLKDQLEKLSPVATQMEQLAKVFAPESADSDTGAADALAEVQRRLDAYERRALVAEHGEGLTPEDKQILSKINDPAVMAEVAARLRDASASDATGNTRRIPKPDRSAGSGSDGTGRRFGSVAQAREDYQARHDKK